MGCLCDEQLVALSLFSSELQRLLVSVGSALPVRNVYVYVCIGVGAHWKLPRTPLCATVSFRFLSALLATERPTQTSELE